MAISVVLRVRHVASSSSSHQLMLPRERVRDGLHGGDGAALNKGPPRRHGRTHDGSRENIATETTLNKNYSQHSSLIMVKSNLKFT